MHCGSRSFFRTTFLIIVILSKLAKDYFRLASLYHDLLAEHLIPSSPKIRLSATYLLVSPTWSEPYMRLQQLKVWLLKTSYLPVKANPQVRCLVVGEVMIGVGVGIILQVIVLNLHLEGLLELLLTELREQATPTPPYVAHEIVMLPL